MKNRILAGAIVILWATPAFSAGPLCSQVFSDSPVSFVANDGFTGKDEVRFRQAIARIHSFLGTLDKPSVKIIGYKQHENPHADPAVGSLSMGAQLIQFFGEKARVQSKHPVAATAILAHEYAHLVFFENMSKLDSTYKQSSDRLSSSKKFRIQVEQLELKIQELEARIESSKSKEEKESLERALEKVIDEQVSLSEKAFRTLEAAMPTVRITRKYDEFFADVVAVLAAENPQAISDAVSFAYQRQHAENALSYKQDVESRNFLNHITRIKTPEEHNFFSKVRAHLWSSYLASPTTLKNRKADILSAVFEAIRAEVHETLKKNEEIETRSWKDLNDAFISRIDHELGLRGVPRLK